MSRTVAAPRLRASATAGRTHVAVGVLALISLALLVALLVVDHLGRQRHIQQALLLTWSSAAFLVAAVSAIVIGALVSIRRPEHPVGWLVWAFGLSILLAGIAESYANAVMLGPPADLGGGSAATLASAYANADFVPWLVLLTLTITLTPSGKLAARWGRPFVILCGSAGVIFFSAAWSGQVRWSSRCRTLTTRSDCPPSSPIPSVSSRAQRPLWPCCVSCHRWLSCSLVHGAPAAMTALS